MTSFQISITPKRKAAARYIRLVRQRLQRAYAEEKKARGLTQSDIARELGVHRSVISRELRGHKDITLGRVGEFAWVLGRDVVFDLPEIVNDVAANVDVSNVVRFDATSAAADAVEFGVTLNSLDAA